MEQSEQLPIRIRDASEGDVPFIFNSWLKSNRQGEPWSLTENATYFAEHHKLIEGLLKRCKTVVACDPNDVAQIYGWACFEHVEGVLVIHYVYVKHTFRNLGIAKELVAESGHDPKNVALFTHWTRAARDLRSKHNLLFHPYILINYNK